MSVSITGIGMVTALGLTPEQAWQRCIRGESGIAGCRQFDTTGHACHSAAAVADYQLGNLRPPKNQKFLNRGARHLMRAALQALSCASAESGKFQPGRISIYTGSGHVGPEPSEFFRAFGIAKRPDGYPDWDQVGGRASRLLDPYFPLRSLSNSGVALLAMEMEARGPTNNFVHTDVASALALDAAYRDLIEGRCDLAVAAGFECLLTPGVYLAFEKQGLLSSLPPERALRPFDRDADGLVLGEGAAAVVLERSEDARRRGAPLLAEVSGFATATEVSDCLEPLVSGEALASVARSAAGGDNPDFLVASGFGVPEADRREAAVLSAIFGNQLPVTAFKGFTGYVGAATALVEIVLGVLALRHRTIPPIAHHSRKADGVDLNLVASGPMTVPEDRQLSALFLTNSWSGQSAGIHLRLPKYPVRKRLNSST